MPIYRPFRAKRLTVLEAGIPGYSTSQRAKQTSHTEGAAKIHQSFHRAVSYAGMLHLCSAKQAAAAGGHLRIGSRTDTTFASP